MSHGLFEKHEQGLPIVRRLAILAIAGGVAAGAFLLGVWLLGFAATLERSIHTYVARAVDDGLPFIYGRAEIIQHFKVDGAGAARFAAWDLLFPLLYGFGLLVAFRTLLIAYPCHVVWTDKRDKIIFLGPLLITILCDWIENLLILFLHQGWSPDSTADAVPFEIATLAGFATLIKTAAFAWTVCGLLWAGLWLVLVKAHVIKKTAT